LRKEIISIRMSRPVAPHLSQIKRDKKSNPAFSAFFSPQPVRAEGWHSGAWSIPRGVWDASKRGYPSWRDTRDSGKKEKKSSKRLKIRMIYILKTGLSTVLHRKTKKAKIHRWPPFSTYCLCKTNAL